MSATVNPPRLAGITEMVLAKPSYAWTTRIAARESGLSYHRFLHIFTEETGTSFYQFVIAQRIKEACRLIDTTDLRTKQIAYSFGMTAESFHRQFKQRTGLTPREWRNRNTKERAEQ